MLAVVEQHDLAGAGSGVELPALGGVGDGDVEAEGRRPRRGAVERHAALHQGAEHREEPSAGALDLARVGAVRGHVAVAVEQVRAGDPHLVEVQAAVVDAVQSALEAVVLAADARQECAVLVAERHVEAVHAVVDAVGDQLREHGRGDAVQGGVAEVVLPGAAEGRVEDELLGVGVVGGRRADRRDIRAVSRLGHRERAGDLEVHDAGEPLVVVLLGAQLQHRRAEEAPLHARFDLQARVGDDELLEAGDVRAVVRPRRRTPSGRPGGPRRAPRAGAAGSAHARGAPPC